MKAQGQIEIEAELVLNSPTLELYNISYPQSTNKVIVEIRFKEENSTFKHSRSFTFDNKEGKDLSYNDVLALVKAHPILGLFK